MMVLRSIFLFFEEGLNLAVIGKTFEGYLIKSYYYFARLYHVVLGYRMCFDRGCKQDSDV